MIGSNEIKVVGVIGAGLMGHGIAQIFAHSGLDVLLQDIKDEILEKALQNIKNNLSFMSEHGLIDKDSIEPTLSRIRTTTDLSVVASSAQFICESVTENLSLKQDLFYKLDSMTSENTILATNTSVLRITEVGAKVKNLKRVIGTHFWNPPYLIPLVEVIPAEGTAEQTIEQTLSLLRAIGKHPVRVKKDVPGFIGNRLQHALWREAISLVDKGIADPDTVDEVIKKGFGIRLSVLGPIENADLVGLDLTLEIHNYILKYLEDSKEPAPILIEKVKRNELGFKTMRGFKEWDETSMKKCREKLLLHLITFNKEKRV